MASVAQSAVALRCMIREFVSTSPGNGEDLQNINTANLPDGAQCFVTTTRQLFRFRKFSTLAASSDTVIVPSSGGGRWVLEGTTAGALGLFVAGTSGNSVDSSASGDWLGSNTANYALQAGGGAWTLTASTCIVTYNGPASRFLLDLRATLTFPGDQSAQVGIDHADDLTGTDAGFAEGIQFYDNPIENSITIELSTQRLVTIAPSERIQPKYRLSGSASDLEIERMTLSAIPIP